MLLCYKSLHHDLLITRELASEFILDIQKPQTKKQTTTTTTTKSSPNKTKQRKKASWTTLWKVAPEQISASVNLVLSLPEKYQFN